MNFDALVVGINNYEHLPDDRQLGAPANDAELIAQRLEAQGLWQVTRLPEAETKGGRRRVSQQKMLTVRELETAIEDLFYPNTRRNQPDAALLYFSGHGLRKTSRRRTEGFLAASDVDPGDDRWGISLKWLRELLQDSEIAAQVVWLDCCHGGELLNFEEANPGEQGLARDRCFIAASQDHRLAYESGGNVPYSELTRVLWQGLDAKDRDVTSFDLQRSVGEAFGQQTQKRQRPVFQTSGSSILLVPGVKPLQQSAKVIREENPYQGLNAFTKKTAEFFFGRETATQEILQKLSQSPFVPVIGVSGSGKSSVVRAGVMARLEPSAQWVVLPAIKPGDSPIDPVNEISRVLTQVCGQDSQKSQVALAVGNGNLAEAIDLLPGEQNLLLVVDQFEEIFTVCPPEQEKQRRNFLQLLVELAHQPDSRLRVVTTMRADFFEQCLTYRDFGKVIKRQQVLLLPMADEELQAAIVEPAGVQGYGLEERLLEMILEDVAAENNCLPLLQFALTQLWEQRDQDRHVLTEAAYRQMGRLMGALNTHAESIYAGTIADIKLRLRSDEQQEWARRICLKLVRTGMAAKDTRQRQPQQLVLGLGQSPQEQQTIAEVIGVLVNGRLLVRGAAAAMAAEDAFETSAVVNHGSTAQSDKVWIDLAHEALLEGWDRFAQWRQEDRDLRRLVQRVEDGEKEWGQKGGQEGYLLQGGLLAEVREQWDVLQSELGQSTQQYYQQSDQREQHQVAFLERALTEAKLREEAVQILNLTKVRPYPETALRAIQAVGTSHRMLGGRILTPVQNNLPAVIDRIREWGCLQGHSGAVRSVAFSPDGNTVASGSKDTTIRLWDLNGTPIGEPFQGHSDYVWSVAFSPDGNTVASGSKDTTIRLWDLNGTPIGEPFQGHSDSVRSVAFSPDGKTVVSGSNDTTIRLWDLNGTPIGEPFQGHSYSVLSVAFSPDGKTIVSSSNDKTIRLWDLNGTPISEPFQGHSDCILSVAFSPDGNTVVSGSDDKTIRLWDLNGTPIGEPFQGHSDYVNWVAFSPDGNTVVSGSDDKTIRLWDLNGIPIGEPFQGHSDSVWSVAFSPDGDTVVSGSNDKTIRLWDLNGTPIGEPFQGHSDSVRSVAFSPDGNTVVSGSNDKTIRLWDLNGIPIGEPFQGHSDSVRSVAFSPDGNTVVSSSDDKTIRLWDWNGTSIGEPLQGYLSFFRSMASSPDGNTVVSGSDDTTIRLWDLNGTPISEPFQGHSDSVLSVAFSPDGNTVVSGSNDKTIRLWDLNGIPIGEPFQGHSDYVLSVAFSPDGKTVVSGSADNTIRLWDLNGTPIGEPFQGHSDYVLSVAFSPDGKTVVSGSADNTIRLWRGSWRSWLALCCNRLRHHPIFKEPPNDLAQEACEVCQRLVWDQEN